MLATNELLSVNNSFYHTVVFVTMQKLSAFLIHLQNWAELKIAKICSGNYIHPARNCLLTDTNMRVRHLMTETQKNFGIRFGQGCQRFCNLVIATKIFHQGIMRFSLGPHMCLALPKSETSLEQEHTHVTLRIFRRGQHKRSFISCSFLRTHGKKICLLLKPS